MPKSLDIPVPDLAGRLALVTGASDGVGFEIAARLARAGAEILMPVRNLDEGRGGRGPHPRADAGCPHPRSPARSVVAASRWHRSPMRSSRRAARSTSRSTTPAS